MHCAEGSLSWRRHSRRALCRFCTSSADNTALSAQAAYGLPELQACPLSQRVLIVLQAQGAAILQNLHSQRETIQRSQQRLHEADDNISASQKILKRMGRWLPF